MLYYYANLSLRYFFFFLSQALWWGAVSMAHQVRGSSWAVDSLIQMLMLDKKKSEMLSKSNNSSKIRLSVLLQHVCYIFTAYEHIKELMFCGHCWYLKNLSAKNAVLSLLAHTFHHNGQRCRICTQAFSCLWGCMLSVNNSSVAFLLPHFCKEMLLCLICAHVIGGLCVFSLAIWTVCCSRLFF